MKKFWEMETPRTADTQRNILTYYPKAGKLQISMQQWTNEDGVTKPGKTVTLDLKSLYACREAMAIIYDILPTEESFDEQPG